jgi:hypothetical protein
MIYLVIEFIDELVFGVGETAWPLFRNDLCQPPKVSTSHK